MWSIYMTLEATLLKYFAILLYGWVEQFAACQHNRWQKNVIYNFVRPTHSAISYYNIYSEKLYIFEMISSKFVFCFGLVLK